METTPRAKHRLAALVKELRGKKTYQAFGDEVGTSGNTVRLWEAAKTWPDEKNLRKLAELKGLKLKELKDEYLFIDDDEEEEVEQQGEQELERSLTFQGLLSELRSKIILGTENLEDQSLVERLLNLDTKLPIIGSQPPSTSYFYGRRAELAYLKEIVIRDNCVIVYGPVGIGKSCLIAKLVKEVAQEPSRFNFKYYIWRSIAHAPSLDSFLTDLLNILGELMAKSPLSDLKLPKNTEDKVSALIRFLTTCRCLLVLDGVENAIQKQRAMGWSSTEAGAYSYFLGRVTEENHPSCVIVTTLDPITDVKYLEDKGYPVRSIQLKGLMGEEALEIFRNKGLKGEKKWRELRYKYRGNPLFLKMIADEINNFWDGDVEKYFEEETTWIGEPVQRWLDFELKDPKNLSHHEKQVIHYLVEKADRLGIIKFSSLLKDFREQKIKGVTKAELFKALKHLEDKSLVEVEKSKESNDTTFLSLQPVARKYILEPLLGN